MLDFLKENIGTIIVSVILLAIVGIIIARLIMRKKAGKCIACDSCDSCFKSCPSKQKQSEIINK